ncbi:MAG: hypothetical protein QGH69_05250 [Alphaproteobacteria bacterium]|jgi:hypothetical protein|nr:hypothetical protein [Alphaproteobacteria bacterium]
MIYLAIILYMGIMSGYAGGSLPHADKLDKLHLTWLPELLFALPFGLVWWPVLSMLDLQMHINITRGDDLLMSGIVSLVYVIISVIVAWSYIWMQTGHANALPWGKGGHDPERTNTLSPIIKWLSDRLRVEYYSTNYARLFMAVKGCLIGLPVGGLTLLIGWPLGYEIGSRAGNHAVAEVAAGCFAGCGVSLALFVIQSVLI